MIPDRIQKASGKTRTAAILDRIIGFIQDFSGYFNFLIQIRTEKWGRASRFTEREISGILLSTLSTLDVSPGPVVGF